MKRKSAAKPRLVTPELQSVIVLLFRAATRPMELIKRPDFMEFLMK